jgi:membrane protein
MPRHFQDPRERASERSSALAHSVTRALPRRGPLARASRFLADDLWTVELSGLSAAMRGVYRAVRVSFLTAVGFFNDRCALRASSLAYVTVLSLVPLLALSFSVLKGLGFYEELVEARIRPFLKTQFERGAPELYRALEQVLRFVQATDAKALGWIGLVILLYTLVRVLGAIEATFNEIFGALRARSLVRKLSDYLTIVVVAPILLGVALTASTLAQSSSAMRYLHEDLGLGRVVELLFKAVPLLVAWFAFTVFYLVIPNSKVGFRSALLGGVMAGSLWIGALWLHVVFQVGIARYNPIYSSFAALPIFLVWVQISWVVVLLGAELASSHQFEPSVTGLARTRLEAQSSRETAALRVAAQVAAHFQGGLPPLSTARAAALVGVQAGALEPLLSALRERGLLALADAGGEEVWLPGRDPAQVRIADVQDALRGEGEAQALPVHGELERELDRLLAGLAKESHASAYNRTLAELGLRALTLERGSDRPTAVGDTPRGEVATA